MSATYDVVLRGGLVVDGTGREAFVGDVAISGDRIAEVAPKARGRGALELDVRDLAIAPGFINMLSWAIAPLFHDGRSLSDIKQGVTLEVFGEGWSMGPYTEAMRREVMARQGDITYEVDWTTLGEGLQRLQRRGVSCNIASFVGAATVRIHELGYEDRRASPEELGRMRALVRQAMRDGALGVGSALIYTPATFADTDELAALASAAAESGGMYISHLRNEGDRLLDAVDELIEIARRARCRAEIYHLKQAGAANWSKLEDVVARIEAARAGGLAITADMYPYTAGATGLDAAMPPWSQEGGHARWIARLREPGVRSRVIDEMRRPGTTWDNLYRSAGSADNILLLQFKNPALKPLTGKTLAAVARLRGSAPEATAIDLVIEDDSRVGCAYFLMAEPNVHRQIGLPWMSFGSDAGSLAPEGPFLLSNPHPRAYGTFARLLGQYVRDGAAASLPDAVRRLTSFPATNLKLVDRGLLSVGSFADVVAFDPVRIRDHATYDEPHRFASGLAHVFVNGIQVLRNGEHTGATPGRVVHGPGFTA
ncbi:MAG TPA: D-aminoacylase [Candidatus Limnocylindria bacterium]|nr:D-aminoacylase [Candidatus Limnocylindria bacterium]